MELNRDLLLAMGFEPGTGEWKCETYVFRGAVWVHFNDVDGEYTHRGEPFANGHIRAEETDLQQLVLLMWETCEQEATEVCRYGTT